MPGETPSDGGAAARAWCVRAVWVSDGAEGVPGMELCPPDRTPGETCFLTNRSETLRELLSGSPAADGWWVVDFAELHRLVLPDSPAESVDEMLADSAGHAELPAASTAGALWQAWQRVERIMSEAPLWALETCELAHRELGEHDLARLLNRYADAARLRGTACGAWTDSFPVSVQRVQPRTLPALSDCSPLDADAAARLLAPDGGAPRCLPGYEPRPGQLTMARAVVEAFNTGRHLMVEAGTGVGKSLAYLVPAALWSRLNDLPVVVSTNTKNLQTQLAEKDLPTVRALLASADIPGVTTSDRPLRVAVIKGRTNYLCMRRLGFLLEHGQYDLPRQDLRQFARAAMWAVQTTDGDLDALSGGGCVDPAFMSQLSCSGEECPGRACRHYRRCFLQKARERSLRADLIVANHALVFAELGTPGIALPPHAQMIFDEAHNLEESATRHFSIEFSPTRLAVMLRRLAVGRGRRSGGVLEVLRRQAARGGIGGSVASRRELRDIVLAARDGVDRIQEAGHAVFHALHAVLPANGEPRRFGRGLEALADIGPPDAWVVVHAARVAFKETVVAETKALQAVIDGLVASVGDELNLMGEECSDLAGAIQSLQAFALDMDMVLAGADAEHVFWAQRARTRERFGEAWAAPLACGPRLAASLYSQKQSIIFCSATLSVGGSFRFMAGRLGLDQLPPERLTTCVAPSPFDFARQCRVVVPTYLPEPGASDRSYAHELADLLRAIAEQLRGRTLGLFTSYEMMRHCARDLAAPMRAAGIRLLVQGESGSRDQLTRIFRRGGNCLLLGTHSFWEGVDVVGDALSCVVMARLPFVAPSEPVFDARCKKLEAEGGRSFSALSLPTAIIRFRQGFGRLIRHRTDRGLVIVTDTRIISKHYGGAFRHSLPCPTEVCADRAALLARVSALG